jgi:hypothetical protein
MAHGLDPSLFSIHASASSKRGIVFQTALRAVLLDSGFEEALNDESIFQNNQFVFNRSISQCNHLATGCRPDFVFKDLIIDTKVGGILAKPAQLERYLDHRSKVVVVTANDKPKTLELRNGCAMILGLKEYIDQATIILGHPLTPEALSRLKASLTVRSAVSTRKCVQTNDG